MSWQQHVIDIISDDKFDSTNIVWITDNKSRGKSWLARYLAIHREACVMYGDRCKSQPYAVFPELYEKQESTYLQVAREILCWMPILSVDAPKDTTAKIYQVDADLFADSV